MRWPAAARLGQDRGSARPEIPVRRMPLATLLLLAGCSNDKTAPPSPSPSTTAASTDAASTSATSVALSGSPVPDGPAAVRHRPEPVGDRRDSHVERLRLPPARPRRPQRNGGAGYGVGSVDVQVCVKTVPGDPPYVEHDSVAARLRRRCPVAAVEHHLSAVRRPRVPGRGPDAGRRRTPGSPHTHRPRPQSARCRRSRRVSRHQHDAKSLGWLPA
jgi:hypothetical protein